MHRLRCWIIAMTSAVGMVVGMEFLYSPLSIAPPGSCTTGIPKNQSQSNSKTLPTTDTQNMSRCAVGLDLAFYSESSQPENLLSPYQNFSQEFQQTEDRVINSRFNLYSDTNRDGKVNTSDFAGRGSWTWQQGAFILFNNDDDDGNNQPDWQDQVVNGEKDVADLAKINLKLGEGFSGEQVFLVADSQSRAYINVFQKTNKGWQPIAIDGSKPIQFSQDVVFGVEAKQFANRHWNGLVTLQAVAQKNKQPIAADTVKMRVTPWIMLPNTAPVKELYVSARGWANQQFVSQIKTGVEATGAKVNVVVGGTTWKQDTMEIGYVQFPTENDPLQTYNVVLNGLRASGMDYFPRSLLSVDFGWFEVAKPRPLDALNQWTDWFGNLEVTPPLPGYPHGRIYYGNAGTVAFNPQVVDFLSAQEVQGPPVDLDTSWLMIRHVDEIISFIPTPSGKPLMMIVSPEDGVNLLKELQAKGHGNELVNRGLSTQTTVDAALSDTKLIEHNLQLQRNHLNPIIEKVKQEFGLSNDQIIRIPAMFGYEGYAWWPNMVNSVVVNGQLMASSPRGAMINGKDYTQETFRRRVARSGLRVYFLDDRYYQELRGNTHCATNTRREAQNSAFWQALPFSMTQR